MHLASGMDAAEDVDASLLIKQWSIKAGNTDRHSHGSSKACMEYVQCREWGRLREQAHRYGDIWHTHTQANTHTHTHTHVHGCKMCGYYRSALYRWLLANISILRRQAHDLTCTREKCRCTKALCTHTHTHGAREASYLGGSLDVMWD